MEILTATDETYAQLVIHKPATLVYFWRDNCDFCTHTTESITKISEVHPEIQVIKAKNTDNYLTGPLLGLDFLPAFVVYKNGRLIDRFFGNLTYEHIEMRVRKDLVVL